MHLQCVTAECRTKHPNKMSNSTLSQISDICKSTKTCNSANRFKTHRAYQCFFCTIAAFLDWAAIILEKTDAQVMSSSQHLLTLHLKLAGVALHVISWLWNCPEMWFFSFFWQHDGFHEKHLLLTIVFCILSAPLKKNRCFHDFPWPSKCQNACQECKTHS